MNEVDGYKNRKPEEQPTGENSNGQNMKVADSIGLGSKAPKFVRMILYVLCSIAVGYVFQFAWLAMESMGQNQTDYAWEVLAHEALSAQYNGVPYMRIGGGKPSHSLCNFWSFEAIWGACVTVRIPLFVQDYQPEYRSIVEGEVARFADQMRMPCRLLPQLALPNEAELAKNLGCNGWKKKFKLFITVSTVTVTSERGPPDRPNRWSLNIIKHLYTYDSIEGEL